MFSKSQCNNHSKISDGFIEFSFANRRENMLSYSKKSNLARFFSQLFVNLQKWRCLDDWGELSNVNLFLFFVVDIRH